LYIVSKANPLVDDCDVRRSIKGTLKNIGTRDGHRSFQLGVTYLDLYLLHAPPQSAVKRTGNGDADIAKQWAELEALQAEGLVKSIGVSNYRVKDMETLLKTAKVTPAVNQIEFHPLVLKASEPLLELQKEHGILVENYGGLGTLTWGKGTEVDGVVSRIAQETGRTEGQVLLKWLLQTHGGIAVT
jgi:diketogulonate reductase-like aldo/keto reductase